MYKFRHLAISTVIDQNDYGRNSIRTWFKMWDVMVYENNVSLNILHKGLEQLLVMN